MEKPKEKKDERKKKMSITGGYTLSCKNRPRRNLGPRKAGSCPGIHNSAERDQHTWEVSSGSRDAKLTRL